jgi:Dual specificity phosphatase, catalytic domain
VQQTSDLDLLDDPLPLITATPEFTFDAVIPGLYQGDFPAGTVDWSRFDDVVSLTIEDVPGVRLQVGGLRMHVPIWDDEMVNPTGVRAAALTVAERVTAGNRVLVHCWAGLNRSGVVSARALMFMGIPVAEAIARVRSARGPYALSNRDFVAWLHEEAVAYDSGDAAEGPERPRQLLGGA